MLIWIDRKADSKLHSLINNRRSTIPGYGHLVGNLSKKTVTPMSAYFGRVSGS